MTSVSSMAAGSGSQYEVLAVRYGTRQARASEVFLNFHTYGEADRPLGMDYFFWIARNGARTVVIDTGFSEAGGAARGRTLLSATGESLRRAEVSPGGVGQVVVTHAHYDHIGGLPALPSSEVVMSRAEFGFWTSPMASRQQFAHSAEPAEIGHLRELREAGRLTLVSGTHPVAPGIEFIEVGGHTPGQAVVTVATASGRLVLAADAVHYYEELERDRPFSVVADVPAMYAAFDLIREMESEPGTLVVAGHDPLVAERFGGGPGQQPGDVLRLA